MSRDNTAGVLKTLVARGAVNTKLARAIKIEMKRLGFGEL